jgi:phage head maturation protease
MSNATRQHVEAEQARQARVDRINNRPTKRSRGLRYRIDTPDYRPDIVGAIQRGDVTGSSFAFEVTDQRMTPGHDKTVREILGVTLHDVGPVTYPPYTSTSVKVMA